ncbi:MAG: carbamoyltransferase HypF [Candidatus Nanopelagicales bacterium]
MTVVRVGVRVTGVVQGVGFRPFVHGLATGLGLAGHVGNDAQGVFVEVEGPDPAIAEFVRRVRDEAPPLAVVESVTTTPVDPTGVPGFVIVTSREGDAAADVALIPPDTAVCPDCLADVADPGNRRYRYPFTACTYCGPRYTIVTGLPYDRPFTTMAAFPLCADCAREYEDPADRRFHAQPTACPRCGPTLRWRDPDGADGLHADAALAAAQDALAQGRIVAVKGVGGYHLACDARDAAAVHRLRDRKARGDKPFAVMVRDLDAARSLVHLDPEASALLTSPQAPIVLAPVRDDDAAASVRNAVAPHQGFLGVLLPYSPLHHLLLSPHPDRPAGRVPDVVVMTSGNLSDEPLAIDPTEAEERLAGIADAFLHHDRGIHVSCDDSVVRVVDGDRQPVRRSRGYAPMPVRLPLDSPPALAVGGELKTTVCVASGRRAWMSQHIGDTANLETLALLERTADTLSALARVDPGLVVADLHPGYLSRRWAEQRAAATGARLRLVQHHHAHLGSLLAEHGVAPGEPVLGVAFDGTGYGTDGTIWGGELLLGSYQEVERVGHLRPVSLPGGDAAIRRPARTALAHLAAAGVDADTGIPAVAACDDVELRVVGRLLQTGAGCTPTTSVGRLFDAVASLLGVRHDASYEGQAAIELEALAAGADPGPDGAAWRMAVERDDAGALVIDPRPAVRAGAAATRAGVAAPAAARAFHEALADAVRDAAVLVRAETGVVRVGLTGGVFQNSLLTAACRGRLEAAGLTVLVHRVVPPNDGGLALGQAAVAASGGGVAGGGGT